MPSTNYTRGRSFEYELKSLLESAGYNVIRGAGSKGSVFGIKADLVATKQTAEKDKTAILVIVQCKMRTRD